MIQDNQTNKVYLAKGFSYYQPVSMELVQALYGKGIEFEWLPRTESSK